MHNLHAAQLFAVNIISIFLVTIQLPLVYNRAANCACTFNSWTESLTCNYSNSLPRVNEICGDSLASLSEIKQLEIVDTSTIPMIDTDSFRQYSQLFFINMEGCEVRNISSGSFRGCREKLRTVRLSDNYLHHITDAFSDLPFLKELYLMRNRISVIEPEAFKDVPSLEVIYLDQNQIQNLPNSVFGNLPKLIHLHLEQNLITSIPSNFMLQSTNLKNFFAQGNQITDISPLAFAFNTQLREIHLQQNQIHDFSSDIYHGLSSLEVLDISGNPLVCSCTMVKVKLYLTKSNNTVPSCRLRNLNISFNELTAGNCINNLSLAQTESQPEHVTSQVENTKSPQNSRTQNAYTTHKITSHAPVFTTKPATKPTKYSNSNELVEKVALQTGKEGATNWLDNYLLIAVACLVTAALTILLIGCFVYFKRKCRGEHRNDQKGMTMVTQRSNHTYDSIGHREALPSCSSVGSAESADSSSILLQHSTIQSLESSSSGSSQPIQSQYYDDNNSSTYSFNDDFFAEPAPIIVTSVNQSGLGQRYSRSTSQDRFYLTPIPERRNAFHDPLPPRPNDDNDDVPPSPDSIYVAHGSLPLNHYSSNFKIPVPSHYMPRGNNGVRV